MNFYLEDINVSVLQTGFQFTGLIIILKKGLFWSNSTNFDEMITLIDSVKMINAHDWERIYKDYSKKILPYDKENKFKKSVIYNFFK